MSGPRGFRLPTFSSVLVVFVVFVAANLSIQLYLKESRNGGYSKWSPWSNCSHACGEGTRTRTRSCDNPAPGFFGFDCSRLGPSDREADCFVAICPINGNLGPWSEFGACDKTCGGGVQVQTRACDNPPPAFGGKSCDQGQSLSRIRSCNTQTCPPPVHGGFSVWSPYTACSVTCGVGKQTRTRTCTNPPPANGGKPCEGKFRDDSECRRQPCVKPSSTTTLASPAGNRTTPAA